MEDTNNIPAVGRAPLIAMEAESDLQLERQWPLKTTFGVSVIIHLGVAIIFACCATQTVSKSREQEIVFVDLSQPIVMPVTRQAGKSQAVTPVQQPPRQLANSTPPPSIERSAPAQVTPTPQVAAVPKNTSTVVTQVLPETTSALGTSNSNDHPSENAKPANTAIEEINRPGGDVTFGAASAPSFSQRSIPAYPMIARRFGKEGTVIIRLSIDEHGSLSGAEVIQDPGYGFAAAAVEAVKKSRFNPARSKGKAISAKALLPVRFALSNTN